MRVAIIGCGHWGKNYVRIFDQLSGISGVDVADPRASHLDFIGERFQRASVTADCESLLRNPEIDAVVIATPASSHYPIAIRALESGKHLLVEKPLALDPVECERLIHEADVRGLVLMVGHTFLYNDSIRKIKEVVQQEETGEVYYLTARRNHLGTIREDVGVLWDLAAHDVSIFSYLLGRDPTAVSAVGSAHLLAGREDVAFVTLFYPGGAVGNIQASWVDAHKIRELVLITAKRRIEFNDLDNLESVRVFEKGICIERDVDSFGEFQYRLRDGDIFSPKVERREPLKTLCEHFVECVKKGERPLTDGPNGTQVVRVLKAASESMAKGGRQIPI
jgi:predicted dehydrogenase